MPLRPVVVAAVIVVLLPAGACVRADAGQAPQFTADGKLLRPQGWDAWVMVGASTGLSYNAPQAGTASQGPGMFHNVYMQPWAYREFMRTGAFPEGTMMVLSFYEPSQKSTPARAGFYEGDQMAGIEVHIKKAGIDSTGWAFFGFGDTTTASTRLPSSLACYTCHAKEAAHDNVFTQFYPFLRARLAQVAGGKPVTP